ncbi:diphthine synthase [Candidatus Woesearchaeota archaeon]|nr:diphthine synthase [Candidatus Woesearchaeota archaeon]
MALYFIGTGLGDEKDLSIRAIEVLKGCKSVYLEGYTSKIFINLDNIEKIIGKKIILADRNFVEQAPDKMFSEAKNSDVAFLVIGDPFSATTHADLFLRARKAGIDVKILHNASIINSVGEVGLELYKYGKTTSIPFHEADTPYDVLADNKKIGLHTLLLFDLKPSEDKFMSPKEAIDYLLKIEGRRKKKIFTEETPCVVVSALGTKDAAIKSGTASELKKERFIHPPFCLIVPGKLHFVEEEMMEVWK